MARPFALDSWTPEAVALGRRWVQAWKDAGPRLEAIRRRELRDSDPYQAIASLCGPTDHRVAPRVNAVIAAAAELQAVCEAEGRRFCLIGGVALQRWGEARETVDVDLPLLTGFGGVAGHRAAHRPWSPVESRGCARSWRSSFSCC